MSNDERILEEDLPKIHLDPRVRYQPEHYSHPSPVIEFDTIDLGMKAAFALSVNRPRLMRYLEVMKIRFTWVDGYKPTLHVECVLDKKYGLDRPVCFHLSLESYGEAKDRLVRNLGKDALRSEEAGLLNDKSEIFQHRSLELLELHAELSTPLKK